MGNAAHASAPPELGDVVGSGYELVRFLGSGGVGVVYEAKRMDGRRVAVKVLLDVDWDPSESDRDSLIERFKRESAVLAGLDSPYLMHLLDAGIDGRSRAPFLVMPLLEGIDLRELVRRFGPIHPTVLARIARQACLGLEATHQAGVVHRDIKPGNLFLDHDREGTVVVRVVDFGVAKRGGDGGELTRTGTLIGTPRYMAPEQMQRAKEADARADIWGLGASLHHAASGVVPFAGCQGLGAVCYALQHEGFPSLQELAPWLDPAFAAVIHGTLIRDRDARCPSARALADALEPFTAGSDELTAGMLQGVPRELRARSHAPERLPKRWSEALPTRDVPAAPTDQPDPLLGKLVASRYRLVRRLGRGGMGAVYEAADPEGVRMAVKVLDAAHASASRAAWGRFLREARAVSVIKSDHVVQVLETGTDSELDLPFIAMEKLQGIDLGALIEHQGPLAPRTAARLFIQACRGLTAAHSNGFVHRDIKPANLFLHEQPGGQIVLKVCDFGIVKRVKAGEDEETTAQLTRTGGVVGSPAYMSPEQAKDSREIDLRTDIWSLGVSLFRALTGKLPWAGRESVGELIVAICTEPLPHVQDWAPWVPPGLADVVHRAMRRTSTERFASMVEFAVALEPFSEGTSAVTLAELTAISAEERTKVLRRAAGPETVTSVSQTLTAERGRSAWRAPLAIALVVGVGVAAAGVLTLARSDADGAPNGASGGLASAAGADAGERVGVGRTARIRIMPSDAEVRVGGRVVPLDRGELVLEGEPGDGFVVVVTDGRRRAEHEVVIRRDGAASVDRIDLDGPAPTTPSVAPPSTRAATAATTDGGPPSKGTAPEPTTRPSTDATASGPAAKPKAKEDW